MKFFITTLMAAVCLLAPAADACSWTRQCIDRFVPRVHCSTGRTVLASWYAPDGKGTSSGKPYGGMAVAARDWSLGTALSLFNPINRRTVRVIVDDRGPWGAAYDIGAKLDLQNAPADALGGRDTRYVCVIE